MEKLPAATRANSSWFSWLAVVPLIADGGCAAIPWWCVDARACRCAGGVADVVASGPGAIPGATTSAEPPSHRHARASTHHHGLAAHPPSEMTGSTAAQLNQEEFARVAAGNFSMPPAPPGPEPSASNPEVGPGRATRRARTN